MGKTPGPITLYCPGGAAAHFHEGESLKNVLIVARQKFAVGVFQDAK